MVIMIDLVSTSSKKKWGDGQGGREGVARLKKNKMESDSKWSSVRRLSGGALETAVLSKKKKKKSDGPTTTRRKVER